jgi:hypothetical protein
MTVLEGLLAWQLAGQPVGPRVTDVERARVRGEEYLLVRRLLWRRSDGTIVDPRFTMLAYPTRWYYDVLRALEHFRLVPGVPDPRCEAVVALVRAKRRSDGRWPLELVHQGPSHVEMDGPEGFPSRWNTLRAMRVLRWWDNSSGEFPE